MIARSRCTRTTLLSVGLCWLAAASVVVGQRPEALARQEREQAEKDVPKLIEILGLKPSMSVADIGAGSGEMVRVMAARLGPGSRIYATDLTDYALDLIKDVAGQAKQVTIVRGGFTATNLPDACCDAIYMRNVYHHFTAPEQMNKSLYASLKPGGHLAVIDFEARPGSKLPDGVPANRGGNGIRPNFVVEELTAAGFIHDRTIPDWPTPGDGYFVVVFRKP